MSAWRVNSADIGRRGVADRHGRVAAARASASAGRRAACRRGSSARRRRRAFPPGRGPMRSSSLHDAVRRARPGTRARRETGGRRSTGAGHRRPSRRRRRRSPRSRRCAAAAATARGCRASAGRRSGRRRAPSSASCDDVRRHADRLRAHADFGGVARLAADVGRSTPGCRRRAPPRAPARCRAPRSRSTSRAHLVAHLRGDGVAVDDRRGHRCSVRPSSRDCPAPSV